MQRNSKKRQAILKCLRENSVHPTAEWIYARLKPEFPDISLGTVYRNLGQLRERGEIRSVGVFDGQERYDGDVSDHAHAVCERCGRLIDLTDVEFPHPHFDDPEEAAGFEVRSTSLIFSGLCAECAKKSV